MKVLHILNELKFSGAEIMYTNAAKIFQDLGCELTVLETSSSYGEYAPYFEEAGYKVIHKTYPTNMKKKIQYLVCHIVPIELESNQYIQFIAYLNLIGIRIFCIYYKES